MNEPYTNYWGVNSPKQEGCHYNQGYSESKMINAARKALDAHGLNDVLVAGMDETSIDTSITSVNALSESALEKLGRIDTHTYGGSKRGELKALAEKTGKNLWMSEVDGSYRAGTDAGYMTAGLGLANQIIKDMNGLMPSAWVMWDIIDSHRDNTSPYRTEGEANTEISQTDGIWGIAMADHDKKDIVLTKKYYAYGQFTRYIEPGMTIIASSDKSLAAYDKVSGKIVIVAINTEASDADYVFNMSQMPVAGTSAKVIRTSGDLEGENWAELDNVMITDKKMYTTLKANSITTFVIEPCSYLEAIADDLAPAKNIYGDLYLPSEYNGVQIKWSADSVAIKNNGTVIRSNDDETVKITGEFSRNGETYSREYNCKVMAMPKNKTEKDMNAYLFVHFVGTEKSADEEQIYFSVSKGGQTWKTLNNKQPVLTSVLGEKGVRDPHIIRSPEGDKFYLIATDLSIYNRAPDKDRWSSCQRAGSKSIMIWESDDLVNWSDERMVKVADDNAGCTWAPESVYDAEKGAYMVFWASKVRDDNYSVQRIYRSYTKDFKHFTTPEIYIDDTNISNIDTTFIKENDTYYRFTKNESKSSVTMMSSNSLNSKFTDVNTYTINGEKGNEVTGYEGPTVYKLNGENKWCMLLDYYSKSGGYKPFITEDITRGEFTSAGDFDFDMKYRHGTVIPITDEEYNNLVSEYATTEFEGSDTVKLGSDSKYSLFVNGEAVNAQWSVSDESIAEIDEQGILTAKAIGDVEINAYSSQYGLTAKKEIKVTKFNEIPLTKSMLSGSTPWNNGAVNTFDKTADNNFETFFDGVEKGFVEIDLGKSYIVEGVGYAPRSGFAYRMKDGYFQGSPDNEKWSTIYTISDIPQEKLITMADVKPAEYRYIRYTVPQGSHNYNPNDSKPQEYCCNLSEIKVYGEPVEDINTGLAMHITFDEQGIGSGGFTASQGGRVKEKGTVSYVEGISGKALSIDYGNENYLELPDGILKGASGATVSFWFKQLDCGKDGWPFMTTTVTDGMQVYKSEKYLGLLISKNKKTMTAERYFSNATERPEQITADASYDEWNYITVQYEPDYTTIYINGEKQSSLKSPALLKELFTSDAKSWIGHANWGDGEGLNGMIDDFRIYNRNLSENEIQTLYNLR